MSDEKCDYCGTSDEANEVRPVTRWYTAWGHHAGDLNFWLHEGALWVCGECGYERWVRCDSCMDVWLPIDYCGSVYERSDDDWDEILCPDCARKKGKLHIIRVGPPPARVNGDDNAENGYCTDSCCTLHKRPEPVNE